MRWNLRAISLKGLPALSLAVIILVLMYVASRVSGLGLPLVIIGLAVSVGLLAVHQIWGE